MADNTPTSIEIESDRQEDDSTLASRNESHKSTVVTRHKKDNTVLP